MNFLKRIFKRNSEQLTAFPREAPAFEDPKLAARTIGNMVVITLSQASLSKLPARLEGPTRDVTFTLVDAPAPAILDPNLGWLIPITPATLDELRGLERGDHELETADLAVIVD